MNAREQLPGSQRQALVTARMAEGLAPPESHPVAPPPARGNAPLAAAQPPLAFPVPLASDGGEMGLVLADRTLRPLYTSDIASAILWYPDHLRATRDVLAVQERIRSIFPFERFTTGMSVGFVSGRRRYVCRSFPIDPQDNGPARPMIALLLERRPRSPVDLSAVARHFHLSRRESETVLYLIEGLTTKEVAQRMGVSANTVKQFVRLVMSKMGVATRSGIVGKLISG